MSGISACVLINFCFISLVSSLRLDIRDLNAAFLGCYDYIIVGGGVSGLVVANRLTEDPDGMSLTLLVFAVTNIF